MAGTEVGSLYYDLTIDDKNLNSRLNRSDAQIKSLGSQFKVAGDKMHNAMRTVARGVTLAGGAIVAFGVKSVKAFEESQNGIAQTNAVLKSTRGAAGVTAKAVTELASALQKTTKFSDEEVRSAENLLLTFTKIGKDIFPQATTAVLDMATALGEDTKSASIQLGKALQDPILGITALRRVGVNFSDAQKDVIKNLVDTGHAAEAQKLILKELHTEFGGSAKAAGDTFAGSIAKLKNSFDDLQETIGGAIVKAIQPYISRIQDYVHNHGPALAATIQKIIVVFINFTRLLVEHAKTIFMLIVAYKALKIAIAIGAVLEATVGAFRLLTGAMVVNTVATEGAALATSTMTTTMVASRLAMLASKAGFIGLGIAVTALVGFGIYKLVKGWWDNKAATDATKASSDRLAGSFNFLKLFVDASKNAQDRLRHAHDSVHDAQIRLKQSNEQLAQATRDTKIPQDQLWKIMQKNFSLATDLGTAKRRLAEANDYAKRKTQELIGVQNAFKKGVPGLLITLNRIELQYGRLGAAIQGAANASRFQLAPNPQGGRLLGPLQGGKESGVPGVKQARAGGGSVMTGRQYIVGERGPEVFNPRSDGTIIPNSGGSGKSPTFNIGQINNQQDENWVVRRMDRNLTLESMGLSPARS